MPITRQFVVVSNRLRTMTWQDQANFCQNVIDSMTAEAVTFPTPPVPLATFQSDVDAFQATIDAWGVVGDRGSHADYIALLAAAQQVLNDLDAEAGYVQTVARAAFPGSYPDQVSTVLSAGMRAKNDSNRLPSWGPVNDLNQLVKQNLLGTGKAHIVWKKPNVLPGAMSKPPAYNVYTSDDNVTYHFEGAVSSTNTTLAIGVGLSKYVKVAAVSSAGEGAMASPIQVYGQ